MLQYYISPSLVHCLQDGAIETVVEEKLRGRYLFVSANVVNHPLLSYVHAHLGALLPFHPASKGLNASNSHKPFVVTENVTVLDESPARTSRYSHQGVYYHRTHAGSMILPNLDRIACVCCVVRLLHAVAYPTCQIARRFLWRVWRFW